MPFGAGGTTDMFARIFAQSMQEATGTPFVVESRAGAGGHIDLAFDDMTLAWPQARGGAIRAIAVTSLERSPTAPDVPTVAESPVAGFDATSWHGLSAPKGTPRPIVDKLAAEVKRIFERPAIAAKLEEVGAVASSMTPEAFAGFIGAERAKWSEVVKASGAEAP